MIGTTTAGSSAHPFGYTGRRWDPDLNLYYYRARWYDPQLGTFLETDPIGSLDYVNLYSYVGLEPGNKTDPTGMDTLYELRGYAVGSNPSKGPFGHLYVRITDTITGERWIVRGGPATDYPHGSKGALRNQPGGGNLTAETRPIRSRLVDNA